MKKGEKKARSYPTQFRRNLPHIQTEGRTYFITFCTWDRWVIPENLRSIVMNHCLHDRGTKMILHAAVVMPDHVHLLLSPLVDGQGRPYSLSELIGSIKGASGHSINKQMNRRGPVWQDESFDHIMRNSEALLEKAEYICLNPIRKGLSATPFAYPWLWREGMAETT